MNAKAKLEQAKQAWLDAIDQNLTHAQINARWEAYRVEAARQNDWSL